MHDEDEMQDDQMMSATVGGTAQQHRDTYQCNDDWPTQFHANMPTTRQQSPFIDTISFCAGFPRMLGLFADTSNRTELLATTIWRIHVR